MENNLEENGDKVDSEISITEAPDDPPGEGAIEEDDDVEELHKSLKQIVQDEDVKPKLQCVMMDPSFSMVTVQSEDSGIVWETASSRCSTPWASEASSTSDTYSLDGSGTQGKIVIIMDEDKIIRRRKKRSGRGKIGDRLRRPSSRNFPGGNERPLMAEVSVPNVRPENKDEDGESKMDKEQELFSLVSEGYEILNIVVPSRLPTVDEEDSTDLADNLSYLEENPKIKSTPRYEQTPEQSQPMEDIIEIEQDDQVIVQVEAINLETPAPASFEDTASKQTLKDGTNDMDYFEKFTLLDEHVPGEHADVEESMDMRATGQNKTSHDQEKVADSLSTSEDAFVFISDIGIASEHLDEVFYGNGCDDEHGFIKKFENEEEDGVAEGEKLTCPMKESGSALFVSEETTLTPIFLPSGPPKIIDPILLEEPPAMSFHYSDLYEDAVGVRKKEDDVSDVESVVSETSVQRKLSVDSDEATGYLEKFILKDETPAIEDESVSDDPPEEGRLIWPQSKFELTGCLTRVVEDNDEEEREKEKSTGSLEGTVSPHEDCVAAIMPNDETADLKRAALLKKVDMTGQKSPSICHDTYKSQVEDVERTLEDKNEEIESSLSSDCLVDQELRFKSKADSEETTSVKETATYTTESPKIICEGIGSCEEEIHLKSDEVQVDQETDFMDQETGAEIIVETHKQSSEEVAIGSETAEATTEESVASPGSESMHDEISDAVEIKRTKGDSVEQESAIMQEDMILALAPVESEETSEEVFTDKDIQAKAVKSVDIERTESLRKEIVSDSENSAMKAEKESAYQGVGGMSLVMEPEETIKDEPESDCIAQEMIKASKILRGDATGIDVARKDAVHLNHEPPDGTYAARGFKEKVLGKRTEGDKAKRDASVSKTKRTSQIESQFPQKPSADENTSIITEKEKTTVPEDTHFKLPNDQKNSEEAEGVLDDQIHTGPDNDHLRIHELHRDSQSTPDLGIAEKRKRMLLRLSPLVMAEAGHVGEEEEGLRPSLRSFSPQEDLSAFGHDTTISTPEPFQVLHHDEDKEAEELDYEVITLHEARELPELDTEVAKKIGADELFDEAVDSTHDVNRDKGLEADYEVIEYLNGYPLSQSELVKSNLESRRLGTYCLVCQCPVAADDKLPGEHEGHEVIIIENAYEEIRDKLSKRISVLQERSENVTDLVSELELAYNSVEEHCKANEQCLEEQNEEIMKMVMDQYNEMSQNMEEEKKVKLEQLYDRIVSFQESIDSAKEALEKSTKEIEETDPLTLVSSSKDINTSLTAALDAALSLELTPSAFPLFEDYAKTPSGNGRKELKGIPVPQRPHLQAQETNSATSTSVTVYWKVNEGDIIDCFQVYCMEEPQGAVSEEYRVTVKESYSTLEDLEADKCYKVWVMAVNYTGCSLPSEKLSYKTAPSVPVIDTEKCTVCWDSAMIRWSPTHPDAVESYTLEYCRQYACEGEGLRSISGIRKCEQKVLLHPNENYLFYIKAANAFGASEQSEAALISTRGTRFHLLPDSAHPSLELSEDRATVHCYEESFNQQITNGCREIRGELLPAHGYHYWETTVGTCNAYRIGVAYPTTAQGSPLGEDSTSWCIHCVPTGTSCRFELLHDCTQTAIFTVEVPTRIGILLDFLRGRLSFFNAQNGQLLGSHWHRFTHACHPVLALERPGALGLHMVAEMPEFTKH